MFNGCTTKSVGSSTPIEEWFDSTVHTISRGGEVVSFEAHNLEFAGSNPAPATNLSTICHDYTQQTSSRV